MSKPLPRLVDMPYHVKNNIIEKADLNTRFILRKVNRNLRALVDQSPIVYERLEVTFRENMIDILCLGTSTSIDLQYVNVLSGCLVRNSIANYLKGDCYVERAIKDLAVILRSSKTKVIAFTIWIWGNITLEDKAKALNWLKEELCFEKLGHKLQIKVVSTDDDSHAEFLMTFMDNVDSNHVTKFLIPYYKEHERWNRVFESEQWVNAKEVEFCCLEEEPIQFDFLRRVCGFEKVLLTGFHLDLRTFKAFIEEILTNGQQIVRFRMEHITFPKAEFFEYLNEFKNHPEDPTMKVIQKPNTNLSFWLKFLFSNTMIDIYKEGSKVPKDGRELWVF